MLSLYIKCTKNDKRKYLQNISKEYNRCTKIKEILLFKAKENLSLEYTYKSTIVCTLTKHYSVIQNVM